ncbi:hypothetical protein V6N13_010735 [Hibiscus sabdariffa]
MDAKRLLGKIWLHREKCKETNDGPLLGGGCARGVAADRRPTVLKSPKNQNVVSLVALMGEIWKIPIYGVMLYTEHQKNPQVV